MHIPKVELIWQIRRLKKVYTNIHKQRAYEEYNKIIKIQKRTPLTLWLLKSIQILYKGKVSYCFRKYKKSKWLK